ncbi:SH3 domain-containing protein [Bacillus kwashiorkori]|uniref:SH3 domain-containing protein n=1 Tax=Bacillus kwashiorkori TaxID=1522318 RepID=UPI000782D7DA|nr:SH3 domain-containing protein [Bacillus kwashiorkori]
MKKLGKIALVSSSILLTPYVTTHLPMSTEQVLAASTVSYETTANLNLRTGAGTKHSIITTIPKGKTVYSYETKGNWHKVTYSYTSKGKKQTKTGWVSSSYLKKTTAKKTTNSSSSSVKSISGNYKTTANLNMRSGAGTKHSILLTIPKGKTVTAQQSNGNWYKVSYTYTSKGKKYTKSGWVSNAFLNKVTSSSSSSDNKKEEQAKVTGSYKTTANLNMRTGSSTNSSIILTIPKGKTVSATEAKGTWYKVSYSYTKNGKKYTKSGWVSSSYLSKVKTSSNSNTNKEQEKPKTENYPSSYKTTANLNMRTGAGTNHSIMLTIGNGKTVQFIEANGTWYKISYTYTSKGKSYTKTGWVSSKYLEAVPDKNNDKEDKDNNSSNNNTNNTGNNSNQDNSNTENNSSGNNSNSEENANKENNSNEDNSSNEENNTQEENQAPSFSETKYQTTENLNLRTGAGTNYSIIVTIPKNTIITAIDKNNNWYKVNYTTGSTTKTGWVSGDYIIEVKEENNEPSETPQVGESINGDLFVTTANLRLREKADISSKILATLPNGEVIEPIEKLANGWYKVSINNTTGYVSGEGLEQVVKRTDIVSRDSYLFIDLRSQSSVTADQINQYINSYATRHNKVSVLQNKGEVFINSAKKYGINALFLAAHAIHESAYGTSNLALGKYNFFGFGAYDATPFVAAYRFDTIDGAIDYIAQKLKATYLNPQDWRYRGAYLGFTTKTVKGSRVDKLSEGMNFYYASDENWGKKIAAHMENILPFSKDHYINQKPNLTNHVDPGVPTGSDIFPEGITAVANNNLTLYNKLGGSAVSTLPKGETFSIIEKTNSYWVKLSYNGNEYWTNSIKFTNYKSYITVKNLARITVSTLNVRKEPSTHTAGIGTVSLNQYIHLVLDKNGNPTKDNTGYWYQIKLPDGQIGWISNGKQYNSTYFLQELN